MTHRGLVFQQHKALLKFCKAVRGVSGPAGALGSFRKTELLQLVIASEVFEQLGQVGTRLKRVALAAARRWAGPEQTATGLLVTYLQKNVPSASFFVVTHPAVSGSCFSSSMDISIANVRSQLLSGTRAPFLL